MPRKPIFPCSNAGFTIIEFMIAIAIGLFLVAGMALLVSNTSATRGELDKLNRQIENGRYAFSLIADDLRHAGMFGLYQPTVITTATAMPDPCSTTPVNTDLAWAVQGYNDYSSGLACLPSSLVEAGNDVLVVRRMGTVATASSSLVSNSYYVQPGFSGAGIQNLAGVRVALGSGTFDLKKKDLGTGVGSVSDTYSSQADIHPLLIHVYFISSCSQGTGTGGACKSTDDKIPTLKRLELSSSTSGAIVSGTAVALAEGIEAMQIEYGIDTDSDGVADEYRQCVATTSAAQTSPSVDCSYVDWQNVVGVKLHLLARNVETTGGHSDANKTYDLGTGHAAVSPGGAYKRHVFSGFVRLNNTSMERE